MSHHRITRRELDAILAGLRLSQCGSAWIADGDGSIIAIASEHGDALTNEEIDALCERLNLDYEPVFSVPALSKDELQLIVDALEIVSPDNSEVGAMANALAARFRRIQQTQGEK